MNIKNEYKIRSIGELCDIVDELFDAMDVIKTGYTGEYVVRTLEQRNNQRNCFYQNTLKMNFNPVIRTVRFYDENNECEYKMEIIPNKDGTHTLFLGTFDDEVVDSEREEHLIRTLSLYRVPIVMSEEAYFQQSTVTDFRGVTYDELQQALVLFNKIFTVLKEKFNDNIGSPIVPRES